MKIETTRKPELVIPVASMADIAFLLIVFFMLTSTIIKESGIDLNLPQAKKTEEKKVREKSIVVTRQGQFYLNGVPMSPERIEAELATLLQNAKTEDERAVTIKGDKVAEYQHIVTAIDMVNRLDGTLVLILEEDGPGGDASGKVSLTP